MSDFLLFVAFPYAAIVLSVIMMAYRYFDDRFSYSSQSSQFLENRQLFWSSIPWHYGILIILLAHLLATLFPDSWASFISEPTRLYILEVTGLGLGLFTVLGISLFIVRRVVNSRLLAVTSVMDWVMLALLLLEVVLGVYIAFFYRWGSVWYLQTAAPWLWSLASLNPQVQYIAMLPLIVKLHIFTAFLLVAVLPFTRLVHLFTFPITYLWRPYQVIVWNRRRAYSGGEEKRIEKVKEMK